MTYEYKPITKEQKADLEKEFGGYNDKPPGLRPTTEAHFWNYMQFTVPQYIEWRQPLDPVTRGFLSGMTLFYFGEENFAIEHCRPERKYHLFGCDHDDVREQVGRCYYKYVCQKCGRTKQVDMGD